MSQSGREVNPNSIEAYIEIYDSLEKRQSDILQIVKENPMITSPAIIAVVKRRRWSVDENSITSRLSELVQQGLIKVAGKIKNKKTGRPCNQYVVADLNADKFFNRLICRECNCECRPIEGIDMNIYAECPICGEWYTW